MVKKKFNAQQERLRAERAMQTMADSKRWTKSPSLVSKAASFSPSKLFGRAVHGIADAVSSFFVGTQIEQGDYVDALVLQHGHNQVAQDSDSVSVGTDSKSGYVAVPAVSGMDGVPVSDVAETSQASPLEEQPEQPEITEATQAPVGQFVSYNTNSVSQEHAEPVPATAPVSQQEELAGSLSTIDSVQPEGPVTEEATPQQVFAPEFSQAFDFPTQEVGLNDENPQTPPPPVVTTEAAAQEVDSPQQTPNAEAEVPEPAASDAGSLSIIASVPLDDAENAPLDETGLEPASVPESVIEQTESSSEPAVSAPDTMASQDDAIVPAMPTQPGVFRQDVMAATAPAIDVNARSNVSQQEPVSGGQRRADIQSGKARAGVARKARTQWNPDGKRKGKLSSGAEYDYDFPAGNFAVAAPIGPGGSLPNIELDTPADNIRNQAVEQGDDLSGGMESTAHVQGEIMERMANAIADLAVRLNHAEMILRRVGY